MVDRTTERNRVIMAARDASRGGTKDFTLAEVGARIGISRHAVRRAIGGRVQLLDAMGGQNGLATVLYMAKVIGMRGPAPERLHECMKWLLDLQLEYAHHSATPAQLIETRREVTRLIEGLLAEGVRDGSMRCAPDSAAPLVLDHFERLHSWGTAAISPEMALRGMDAGTPRDDRSLLAIWELFFSRWVAVRDLLLITGTHEGETLIVERLLAAGSEYAPKDARSADRRRA